MTSNRKDLRDIMEKLSLALEALGYGHSESDEAVAATIAYYLPSHGAMLTIARENVERMRSNHDSELQLSYERASVYPDDVDF